jgi:hypothetical protein
MNLHEVKIGDMVTFTTEKGKKVKGKIIHRHTDANKAHLMGHVNVQIDDEGSYPHTVHVSKLKKITEETIMEDMKENIHNFVQAVLSGHNGDAQEMFNGLLADKVEEKMEIAKVTVAQQMFATEEVVGEAVIAPRATPSPDATAAAKADIEKARKKREATLAAAKAELASTSKAELKKSLYSKLYKKESVENVGEDVHDYYSDYAKGDIDRNQMKLGYRNAHRKNDAKRAMSNLRSRLRGGSPKPSTQPATSSSQGKDSHAVHINGKKWKSFSSHSHASNVAKKIAAKKGEGHKVTVEKD